MGVLVGRGVLVGAGGGAADSIGDWMAMVPQARAGTAAKPINNSSQTWDRIGPEPDRPGNRANRRRPNRKVRRTKFGST